MGVDLIFISPDNPWLGWINLLKAHLATPGAFSPPYVNLAPKIFSNFSAWPRYCLHVGCRRKGPVRVPCPVLRRHVLVSYQNYLSLYPSRAFRLFNVFILTHFESVLWIRIILMRIRIRKKRSKSGSSSWWMISVSFISPVRFFLVYISVFLKRLLLCTKSDTL